ncbi:LptF/LptG family permease [Urechidicola croceus]|uniref:Permease n=1 Tax=Urechidicola croceus TaxID=1850246 RepID=A0A1D8P692_9FLAO|nr:LptF/LptG family permease [Urechidicola croceus]AOW20084.1 permease [Urechidicola croceus]
MRILDKYILKKYLTSFVFVLLILIPVIIAVNVSEKIDKFLRNPELTVGSIISDYYVNFIVTIGNMILPLALFISVLFFTSKLAGNTEIIAMNSAKISFARFLKPYFIGATIVTIFSLLLNHFIVPQSSKIHSDFENKYIKKRKVDYNNVTDVNLQLSENDYIYVKSFNLKRNVGFDFCYERYDGIQLKEKLICDNIRFREKDSSYRMTNFYKRELSEGDDVISFGRRMDTVFSFMPDDLLHVESFAKEMRTPKLMEYIEVSRARGRGNLNTYLVELYKRTSLPISSYILTLIAVSLGSVKRRGGIGVNLAIGITLMFIYVFLLKIVEVIGGSADSNPMFLVWLPNIIFAAIAIYLYINARK